MSDKPKIELLDDYRLCVTATIDGEEVTMECGPPDANAAPVKVEESEWFESPGLDHNFCQMNKGWKE